MVLTSTVAEQSKAIPVVNEEPTDSAFLDKSVCVSVSLHRFGVSRKVHADTVAIDEQQTEAQLVRIRKDILDSKEWRAIQTFDGQVGDYLDRRCVSGRKKKKQVKASGVTPKLRSSYLRAGVYLLPLELLQEVDGVLTTFQTVDRPKLVQAFLGAYPRLIEEAEQRLGPALFKAGDYPPVEVVAQAFGMEFSYFTISTPGSLKQLSTALFKREEEKAAAWAQQARVEIEAGLVEAMQQLVKNLAEKLAGKTKDGKAKVIRNTAFDKVNDFLETFAARNIVGSTELADLVAKAKKLTRGLDPESLKHSDTARTTLAKGFGELEKQLDTLLVEKSSRLIEFAEGDE